MNKHYMLVLSGHEMYNEYHLEGENFRDSIKNEIENGDQFSWFENKNLEVENVIDWLNNDCSEFVKVYESDKPFKTVKI